MTLNDSDLNEFMLNFFGYGNLESDVWMIGMEEGGGNSFEEINDRLAHWVANGRQVTEDVAEYHEKFGMGYFFNEKPKNQATWNKLIRIMLAFQGESTDLSDVKSFQRHKMARTTSNNCLLELFPLPSPSAGHWLYAELSEIPWLGSRAKYKTHIQEHRIKKLKALLLEKSPKLVVFYGNNEEYRNYWASIVEIEFEKFEVDDKSAYKATLGDTQIFIINHPVTTGITNEYFHKIGRLARKELAII